ncbi:MAG: sulfotransferase [Gammaproteobacteria bacterium]|nr:sulfotransferase [Gammaproteobacteria bacterium]
MTSNRPASEAVRLPDFVIIGAMKCGTSSLHEQLARQPGCFMSQPKEPNFFSDDRQFQKGLDWYASLFAEASPDSICGESSTHYTKLPTYPQCAPRLHDQLAGAKLVYVMRDPVDRIVSQYIHEWSEHVIDKDCPIDEAITTHPILVDYSRYAMQLQPYVELFGFNGILPVFFERLIDNPNAELRRIATHIGCGGPVRWLDDDAANVSTERQRRHPALDAILDIRLLQRVRRTLLPEALRTRIRSRWTMQERPRLSAKSIAQLHGQLDPEMRTLGEWLGLNLNCRTFKARVRQGGAPEWAREASGA